MERGTVKYWKEGASDGWVLDSAAIKNFRFMRAS